MAFKLCLLQFLNGFKDSLFGFINFFQKQKLLRQKQQQQQQAQGQNSKTSNKPNAQSSNDKLYQRLIQSCILNGIFLLSCILMFNFILMPILNAIAYKIISESYHNLITDYLNPIIQVLFSFVWILPVFLLSKIFNVLCHQEIADIAYVQKYGKPQTFQKFTLSQVIADTVFSCTLELIFLVQSSFMNLIPIFWLNQLLCHVHLAFLYSLYAFEYKLCNMSWDIKKRIAFIETRWAYFLGFGLSLSIILSFAGSYIYCATLFASIFPAFILSAIEAESENLSPIVYYKMEEDGNNVLNKRVIQVKLPLFKFSLYATDFLFKIFSKKQTTKLNQQQIQNSSVAKGKDNFTAHIKSGFTIRKTN
jgi:etoposide-induced 2.4 mRNA